ncbi:hypothetical protein ACLOJK_033714 [Asimina triloba]
MDYSVSFVKILIYFSAGEEIWRRHTGERGATTGEFYAWHVRGRSEDAGGLKSFCFRGVRHNDSKERSAFVDHVDDSSERVSQRQLRRLPHQEERAQQQGRPEPSDLDTKLHS